MCTAGRFSLGLLVKVGYHRCLASTNRILHVCLLKHDG